MASFILTDAGIWIDQFNLSGDFNTVSVSSAVEEKDATTFGDTTRIMKGGLKTVAISGAGFWDADGTDEPDDVLFSRVGSGATALTLSHDGTAEGSHAHLVQPTVSRYEFSPQVGEIKPFSMSAVAKDGPMVKGKIIHNDTRTATGNGTGYELGAVASGQKFYAALHVVTVSGTSPSLTVTIQSAPDNTFAAPTTRVTFTAATAATVEWGTPVSGAITDTYWRAVYTISGTSPSFAFVVSAGIL